MNAHLEGVNPDRSQIAFVTDSTACLPQGWFAEGEPVFVVPLSVNVGDESFLEGESIDAAEVARAQADGDNVTTARPAPGRFLDVFAQAQRAGADRIVCVHLPGGLSATASAARLAASEFELPVDVIETPTIGMGLGFAIRAGLDTQASGGTIDDVLAATRRCADHSFVAVYVDSLDQLRKGGRLGRAGALFGAALSIKPILTIKGGKLAPLERVRSTGKAIERLAALAAKHIEERAGQPVMVAVQSLSRPDLAQRVTDRLRERQAEHPGLEIVDASLGAVITAHVGAGTVGVVVSSLGEPSADAALEAPSQRPADAGPHSSGGTAEIAGLNTQAPSEDH